MAVCMVCGQPANKTQRLVAEAQRVLVGAGETYEARCRRCWSAEPERPAPEGERRAEALSP